MRAFRYVLAALLLVGCGDSPTVLVVSVDSQLAPGSELRAVDVGLFDDLELSESLDQRFIPLDGSRSLPIREEFIEPVFEDELVVVTRAFLDDTGWPAFATIVVLDDLSEGRTNLLSVDLDPPEP